MLGVTFGRHISWLQKVIGRACVIGRAQSRRASKDVGLETDMTKASGTSLQHVLILRDRRFSLARGPQSHRISVGDSGCRREIWGDGPEHAHTLHTQ